MTVTDPHRLLLVMNRIVPIFLNVPGDETYNEVLKILLETTESRHGTNASTITASQSESSNGLTITIEDNGCGIPDNEKEVIFNRGHGKHTGYGLYITREILDLTGIAIKERGIPGKGARFEILAPSGTHRRSA